MIFVWATAQVGGGGGGGGAVDSVFGRIGVVTAQAGDYSAAQITGLAAVATSGAYADLSGTPSSLPPSGAAGGDLSGTYPNPTLASAKQTFLLDRTNHTGTQAAATITGLATVATSGAYADLSGTPSALPPSGSAGGDLSGTYPNPTLSAAKETFLLDRSNHTGTQAAGTITGLATVATSGAYADLSGTPSSLPPSGSAGGDLSGTYPNPTLSSTKETFLLARANHTGTQLAATISDFSAAADARITAQKGVALGLATLDASGKVPSSQLTLDATQYKGTWNATTNSPTLADGTGDIGDFYIVSVAGTQNLGSGSITFAIGDWAFYNGTIWQKVTNSNAVASVNGFTGVVVLSTTDVSEGTNLYFTDSRAQTAAVQNSLTASTVIAPSATAVNTALALKADKATTISTSAPLSGGGDLSANRTLSISQATTSTDGYLSSTDWNTFNGKVSTGSNVGTGSSVFKDLSGTTLRFRKINAGSNVTVTENADDITIASSAPATGDGDILSGTTGVTVSNGTDRLFGATDVTISVQTASGSQPGLLSAADWTTFNGKQSALTFGDLTTATTGVSITGGTGAVIGSGTSISIDTASSTLTGLLSSTDWTTFNNKQAALTIGNLTSSTTALSVTGGTGAIIGSGVSLSIATATGSVDGLLSAADFTTFAAKVGGATNLGASGASVFSTLNGTNLEFRKIIAGDGLSATQNTNDITLNTTVSDASFTGSTISLASAIRSQYRIFTDSSDQTIASLPTPTIVVDLTIVNDSADSVLTLSAASGYPEVVLQPKQAVTLFYSLSQSKWYLK